MSKSEAGKGDTYRKVNGDKYRNNFDNIFNKEKTGLSIIIPLKNRSRILHNGKTLTPFINCIDSLYYNLKNINNINYEIIIVDYMSDDTDFSFLSDYKDYILIQKNKKWSLGEARNFGSEYSNFDYLFFLDADMLIWGGEVLKRGMDSLKNNQAYFPICNNIRENGSTEEKGRATAFGNCFLTKKMVRETGGFFINKDWGGEDSHMYSQLQDLGYKINRDNPGNFYHQWHPKDLCYKYYKK